MSSSSVRPQDRSLVEQAAEYWYQWTTRCFLEGYFSVVEDVGFLPKQRSDAAVLLSAFLLEKASYELVYEMNNRPLWAAIPVNGLLRLLEDKS